MGVFSVQVPNDALLSNLPAEVFITICLAAFTSGYCLSPELFSSLGNTCLHKVKNKSFLKIVEIISDGNMAESVEEAAKTRWRKQLLPWGTWLPRLPLPGPPTLMELGEFVGV